jgi:cyclopropane fatty-acyl-phospholipid synthase-like methyltransferase
VLRACRRLLRPAGRIGFYTIVESPGLSPAARRRARAAGPRAVAMRSDHHRLLRAAGFHDITERDVTPAFAATAAAWLAETEPHTDELARLEPPGAFAQRQADRRRMLAAIHAGLLRRVLLLARIDEGRWRRGIGAPS